MTTKEPIIKVPHQQPFYRMGQLTKPMQKAVRLMRGRLIHRPDHSISMRTLIAMRKRGIVEYVAKNQWKYLFGTVKQG